MTGRIHALALFFALALFLLGLRAWQLQVLEYERYALRSQGNYLKTEDIPAPRGKILDRKGQVQAEPVGHEEVAEPLPEEGQGEGGEGAGGASQVQVAGRPVVGVGGEEEAHGVQAEKAEAQKVLEKPHEKGQGEAEEGRPRGGKPKGVDQEEVRGGPALGEEGLEEARKEEEEDQVDQGHGATSRGASGPPPPPGGRGPPGAWPRPAP